MDKKINQIKGIIIGGIGLGIFFGSTIEGILFQNPLVALVFGIIAIILMLVGLTIFEENKEVNN